MRSRMISRSSSANTPHMPSMARPVGVSLSRPCLSRNRPTPARAHVLDKLRQVQHRAAEAINAPGRDDVELAGDGVLAHAVERRALLAALGAADAVIGVQIDDRPSALDGRCSELSGADSRQFVSRY